MRPLLHTTEGIQDAVLVARRIQLISKQASSVPYHFLLVAPARSNSALSALPNQLAHLDLRTVRHLAAGVLKGRCFRYAVTRLRLFIGPLARLRQDSADHLAVSRRNEGRGLALGFFGRSRHEPAPTHGRPYLGEIVRAKLPRGSAQRYSEHPACVVGASPVVPDSESTESENASAAEDYPHIMIVCHENLEDLTQSWADALLQK